ncbi:helical backbone metal receptor [Ammoniphilus sp. 3BR4]|uniref:helical backbone metal receptor n=1 Tax=Ammoniphilus sp. 3BR4 TaxID=3158265 RepID=UPI0034672973
MYRTCVDHVQREVNLTRKPGRIISLCPSITETLYALGLGDKVVGRTRYCIHPQDAVHQADVVGGTKQIDRGMIERLKPDLIVAEKEENPKGMIEDLEREFPVYVTNVESYEEALKMIVDLGVITDHKIQAERLAEDIVEGFGKLTSLSCRVGYLIWRKPYMAAGKNTYIHSMLHQCGFENVFQDLEGRYPVVDVKIIRQQQPEFLFLSSEPFPFSQEHLKEIQASLPSVKAVLVDGEMFSWYGVRMLKAVDYLNGLLQQLKRERVN